MKHVCFTLPPRHKHSYKTFSYTKNTNFFFVFRPNRRVSSTEYQFISLERSPSCRYSCLKLVYSFCIVCISGMKISDFESNRCVYFRISVISFASEFSFSAVPLHSTMQFHAVVINPQGAGVFPPCRQVIRYKLAISSYTCGFVALESFFPKNYQYIDLSLTAKLTKLLTKSNRSNEELLKVSWVYNLITCL